MARKCPPREQLHAGAERGGEEDRLLRRPAGHVSDMSWTRSGGGEEEGRLLRRPEDVGVHELPARLLRDSSSDGERRTEPRGERASVFGPSPRRGRPCPRASCT